MGDQAVAGMTVDMQEDLAILRPWGALDLEGADAIRPALDEAAAGPATRFLVDLQGVSFIDASGLREFMRVLHTVKSRGGRMAVINWNPRFGRLFLLTGFVPLLDSLSRLGPLAAH